MSESKATTDHEEIIQWVEDRGGHPAKVKGTGGEESTGLLRIDFDSNGDDPKLEHISWDDFFEQFDASDLAFLYQDKTADGEESRFFKFVKKETAKDSGKSPKSDKKEEDEYDAIDEGEDDDEEDEDDDDDEKEKE